MNIYLNLNKDEQKILIDVISLITSIEIYDDLADNSAKVIVFCDKSYIWMKDIQHDKNNNFPGSIHIDIDSPGKLHSSLLRMQWYKDYPIKVSEKILNFGNALKYRYDYFDVYITGVRNLHLEVCYEPPHKWG